jgi:two-component system, probable response regulator PhcQ
MTHKILIVDDEPHVTEALKRVLHHEPYEVLSANYANEALQIMAYEPISVVISDEKMPGMQGVEFLALVYRHFPDTVRIMLTGNANLDLAVRAINEGQIYRFLIKPCNDEEMRYAIRQAIQLKELTDKSRQLLQKVKRQNIILERLGKESPGIIKVVKDTDGDIALDESGIDLESLIREIGKELEKKI